MLDVLIVGAGPVGLHLGALLLQQGVGVRILEQRTERSTHSRAIGIHPPGLAALAQVGIGPALIRDGVHITAGVARSAGKDVTELRFDAIGNQHPFILALPQARTEELLEARVAALDPGALLRGLAVTSVHDAGTHVTLTAAPGCRGRIAAGHSPPVWWWAPTGPNPLCGGSWGSPRGGATTPTAI